MKRLFKYFTAIALIMAPFLGAINAQSSPENIDYASVPGGNLGSNPAATFAIVINPDIMFPAPPIGEAAAEFNLIMIVPTANVTGSEVFNILDDNMNGGNMTFQPCGCPGDGYAHTDNHTYFSFVYSGSGINLNPFGTGNFQLAFSVQVSNGNPSAVWEIADANTALFTDFNQRSELNVAGFNELYPIQGSAPLPVELTTFNAEPFNSYDALLSWQTASEQNASHYEVERSTDGRSWSKVGNVRATGNTIQAQHYSFVDKGVFKPYEPTRRFYYRLRVVDLDASYEYSEVDEVQFKFSAGQDIDVQLYPNPAHSVVNIDFLFEIPNNEKVNLQMISTEGKLLLEREIDASNGKYVLNLPAALPAAVYMIQLKTNDRTISKRLIVQQED